MLPALSPLPISLMFFSHNKSGPDFLKQTMLWGLSPPITLCQFQSGLKYDSTVCASPCSKYSPPPPFPLSSSFSLCFSLFRPNSLLQFFPEPLCLFPNMIITNSRRNCYCFKNTYSENRENVEAPRSETIGNILLPQKQLGKATTSSWIQASDSHLKLLFGTRVLSLPAERLPQTQKAALKQTDSIYT